MSVFPDSLQRYRRKRMVTGPWLLEGDLGKPAAAAVVIPALAESDSLPGTLHSLAANDLQLLQRTLIVVVVNHRADTASDLQQDNLRCLARLRQFPADGLRLAWVDGCSPGRELPPGQGVGLARKIGFDLCLERLDWRQPPFLVSLDADTLVAPDYLTALHQHFATSRCGGAVIPFRHDRGPSAAHEEAIRLYELYLRSYTFGLKLAGSPYAYTSIGSAFACTAAAYIQAGGMNRRLAGEDFYFLQQLNKTSGIEDVHGTLVLPSPRSSLRVPFGTGQTVSMLNESGKTNFSFCAHSAFILLRQFLEIVEHGWNLPAEQLLLQAASLDNRLRNYLDGRNFTAAWSLLQKNHPGKSQFLRGFHGWFDGLRTRQLLTILSGDETSSPRQRINDLFRWGGLPPRDLESEQLALLEQLQGIPASLFTTAP
ncbi:MAG: hypothetical protein RQ754_05740 [Desulfuromonadales bacterium]|nr:hypothetical protein [Desulfuromonadales bacterium]